MSAREIIASGRAVLGIELGSTRIKACLVSDDGVTVLAVGSHTWENSLDGGLWTYPEAEIWAGLQAAYADLIDAVHREHGVRPTTFAAMGVSAMMHGYLACDASGALLVPFRTWRNTNTVPAAAELSALFGVNIPLRWSIAHLRQATIDAEAHVGQIASITTLAGLVHQRLTGERVLGIGDASGMFPIDDATRDYDAALIARFDNLGAIAGGLRPLLPEVLAAGDEAGRLTAAGAALLDPSGALQPGVLFAPPEGDAGTGMVATGAVAPRTGNVSAGTSIFAMVVLERPLGGVHHEIDLVTTPAGDPVAMVHCNNGASELGAWAGLFGRFAEASGSPLTSDRVFEVLLSEALDGAADADGLVAYNHLAGEPVAGTTHGRPLFLRTPESSFTLANFMRAQVYGMFGTLSLGMQTLARENVTIDRMLAHGGVFRTAGVAQRFLAAATGAPIAVGASAAEGGPWGMAVLAGYTAARAAGEHRALGDYIDSVVFADADLIVINPDPADVAGYATYLDRYRAGLEAERAAASVI